MNIIINIIVHLTNWYLHRVSNYFIVNTRTSISFLRIVFQC